MILKAPDYDPDVDADVLNHIRQKEQESKKK